MISTSKRGFTLIELLVVISIMGILLTLLFPTISDTLGIAERLRARHNMRMLTTGWAMYASDNEGLLLGAEPSNGMRNGAPAWIDRGNTTTAIENGGLWTYIGDVEVYNDPTSILPYYSSFAINGCLNGVAEGFTNHDNNHMAMTTHIDQIEDPAGTFVFIPDYDVRGYLLGSYVIDPERWLWVDRVCGNYRGGDNISFADGHVEYRRWLDPDTLRRTSGNHNLSDTNSEDMLWLGERYFPTSSWP